MKLLSDEEGRLEAVRSELERSPETHKPLRASSESHNEERKRHRRKAKEISRHYDCPILGCGKSYG